MATCRKLAVTIKSKLCRWAMLLAMFSALALGAAWLGLRAVPVPVALLRDPAYIELLDRNGLPLRLVRPDGAPYKTRVTFEEIPRSVIDATLTAEDRRFFQHPGVDWRGYLRAVWQVARYRRVVSGGSTITQQLIKIAEPRPRVLRTKLIEAIKALRLEQVWSKERILAEYLNRVEYGNATAGVASAALFYFRKPVAHLSPAESAFLAALPQAPSRLNPHKHFQRARKRQLWILEEMRALGRLSPAEHQRAVAESILLAKPFRPFFAPHFVDLLLRSGVLNPLRGGRSPDSCRTTLDLALNRFVEQTLVAALVRLQHQKVEHGACVIIENATGDILALVGSPDYYDANAGQVNGAWVPRSTGSTLKPFTYALAFERGASPATVVADVPTDFPTATGVFSPVNFDRHCYGPVSYRVALANSLNIPAVKVLNSVGGPPALHQKLKELGLTTMTSPPEFYGLGLTIGNAEARLLELGNAYATLARLGEFRPLRFVPGQSASPGPNPGSQVISRAAAYLVTDILADNEARALAFSIDSPLRFDFPVACKTGTSSNFRDNWAFGYTPEFTVGVWIGNFNNSPMNRVSGVAGAAPVLHEVMQHLHDTRGTSWYLQPGSVTNVWVHRLTGKSVVSRSTTDRYLHELVLEKVPEQAIPAPGSAEDYDDGGKVKLSAEYADWFSSDDNTLRPRAVLETANPGPLAIVFPLPGTVFWVDPDLPGEGRIIRPRASTTEPVKWRSATLGGATDRGQPCLRLVEGRHTLQAESASGKTAETWIIVKSGVLAKDRTHSAGVAD